MLVNVLSAVRLCGIFYSPHSAYACMKGCTLLYLLCEYITRIFCLLPYSSFSMRTVCTHLSKLASCPSQSLNGKILSTDAHHSHGMSSGPHGLVCICKHA